MYEQGKSLLYSKTEKEKETNKQTTTTCQHNIRFEIPPT